MPRKTNASPNLADVREALQEAYDSLSDAYWASSTLEAKDRIYGVEEVVFDALSELDREEIETNTKAYKEVAAALEPILDQLEKLRDDLESLVHAVKVVTQVTSTIDRALKLATKYFGL